MKYDKQKSLPDTGENNNLESTSKIIGLLGIIGLLLGRRKK
ncbi:LPXTG cell wall anchor domain-containing protein [Macrococcus capreoli]